MGSILEISAATKKPHVNLGGRWEPFCKCGLIQMEIQFGLFVLNCHQICLIVGPQNQKPVVGRFILKPLLRITNLV